MSQAPSITTPTPAHAPGSEADTAPAPGSLRHLYRVYMDLAKARLSLLVVITTLVGFLLASSTGVDWLALLLTVIGTALSAACANAFNQIVEHHRDARMQRTQRRPLPSGRIGRAHAVAFATVCGVAGVALLALAVNPITAALSAATIALYVLVYTPMKTRSTMNTLVGSVVGAIPPVMGWTAVTGRVDTGAWVLAAVLFIWQIPHFLALAWLYREDYERGGYRMLPIIDPSGRITAQTSLLWTVALLPVGIVSLLLDVTGWWAMLGSLLLGVWLLRHAVNLCRARDSASARKLFLASVAYLPLLLGLMVVDRVTLPGSAIAEARAAAVFPTPEAAPVDPNAVAPIDP